MKGLSSHQNAWLVRLGFTVMETQSLLPSLALLGIIVLEETLILLINAQEVIIALLAVQKLCYVLLGLIRPAP